MNTQHPYKHILKNLFHEQATEIIPLLLPDFQVKQAFSVELPDLKLTEVSGPAYTLEMGQGLAELALPGAKVESVYKTEWIEHSGKFERAYRVKNSETEKPTYLVIEFQIDSEDENLARRLLLNYACVHRYAQEDSRDKEEGMHEDTPEYYVYPAALCPFPHNTPAYIRDMLHDRVLQEFNFMILKLWERDAREFLNTHSTPIYFLLPAMKNADAALLGLAVKELVQQFQEDDKELGRHLTGLYLMVQQSELLSDEEKLATQEHLKQFMHLIKSDPYED